MILIEIFKIMYNILQISFIKILKYRPRFYFADLKKYKYGDEKAYFTKEDGNIIVLKWFRINVVIINEKNIAKR